MLYHFDTIIFFNMIIFFYYISYFTFTGQHFNLSQFWSHDMTLHVWFSINFCHMTWLHMFDSLLVLVTWLDFTCLILYYFWSHDLTSHVWFSISFDHMTWLHMFDSLLSSISPTTPLSQLSIQVLLLYIDFVFDPSLTFQQSFVLDTR